jgi:hypothetical protein
MGLSGKVKTMGKEVTAKDLGLDDDIDGEEPETGKAPETGEETKFVGAPDHGTIGAEVVEEEVEKAKARQKKGEEDRTKEELAKLEGKKDEEEVLDIKSKADAEKQVKDALRKMHEATTKTAKLQKIVDDLQERVDAAAVAAPPEAGKENPYDVRRQKIADDTIAKAAAIEQPTPPQVPDSDDPEYNAKSVEYKTKMTEYQKLMLEYNAKVARVWTDAQTQIANLAADEREEAQKNREIVSDAVQKALDEAGIGDIEGIIDLFWSQSAKVPKNKPMEDQIKQTVKQCKTIVDKIRGKETARAKEEKENQEKLDVLGRGARVAPLKKEPEGPRTMGEAQRSVLERRKLRHNP